MRGRGLARAPVPSLRKTNARAGPAARSQPTACGQRPRNSVPSSAGGTDLDGPGGPALQLDEICHKPHRQLAMIPRAPTAGSWRRSRLDPGSWQATRSLSARSRGGQTACPAWPPGRASVRGLRLGALNLSHRHWKGRNGGLPPSPSPAAGASPTACCRSAGRRLRVTESSTSAAACQ